jgi:hypothetical protein
MWMHQWLGGLTQLECSSKGDEDKAHKTAQRATKTCGEEKLPNVAFINYLKTVI